MKIFFDGGCRPNPGAIEIAVVAGGQARIRRDLGEGTSADAEWLALIEALTIAQGLGASDFVLMGDAANIVAKANGSMKLRSADLAHFERFRSLASAGALPRVRYIKRSQNLAGIALARLHDR
jgi:ribonuclease HI